MSGNDFHNRPFDEGTRVKLRLFGEYLRAWLPVFVEGGAERINIVDLFAGPGVDTEGHHGSPLIALKEIRKYTESIRARQSRVSLLLNEKVKKKAVALRTALSNQEVPDQLCRWVVDDLPFEEAFDKYCAKLDGSANLLFLDQSGMKFISDCVFLCFHIFSKLFSLSPVIFSMSL